MKHKQITTVCLFVIFVKLCNVFQFYFIFWSIAYKDEGVCCWAQEWNIKWYFTVVVTWLQFKIFEFIKDTIFIFKTALYIFSFGVFIQNYYKHTQKTHRK